MGFVTTKSVNDLEKNAKNFCRKNFKLVVEGKKTTRLTELFGEIVVTKPIVYLS